MLETCSSCESEYNGCDLSALYMSTLLTVLTLGYPFHFLSCCKKCVQSNMNSCLESSKKVAGGITLDYNIRHIFEISSFISYNFIMCGQAAGFYFMEAKSLSRVGLIA